MKRSLWILVGLLAVLALTFTFVLAQESADAPVPTGQTNPPALPGPDVRPGFVDADGDGVCDNCASGTCGQGFVDADGDGVCDNAGQNGRGLGSGQGNPNAPRLGFVDADGDGV